MATDWRRQLEVDGFVTLSGVFTRAETAAMATELAQVFGDKGSTEASIRGEEGAVYAARNVRRLWPAAGTFWHRPSLGNRLSEVLGPSFGLVRVLFFDKPPRQTWALPWHKDLTVAVRDNRRTGTLFSKPTRKAGVPHAEAPLAVLQQMLTARVHLDDVTDENGPLRVIPGSHRTGKALTLDLAPPRILHAAAGDALLMRPLVAHCSGKSHQDTTRHRRVLHLEFAASPELPDGYAWYDFVPWNRPCPSCPT
jgi:hypothetical protein